jgi:hypothetical protein
MRRYDFEVAVTADWNDWHSATARLADLRDVHWHQPKGAPHPMIHAYLMCGNIANGNLPHRCDASAVPHRVRVCILKCHNIPAVYAELVQRAGTGEAVSHLSSFAAAPSVGTLQVGR